MCAASLMSVAVSGIAVNLNLFKIKLLFVLGFYNHYDWEWPGLMNHLVCMISTGFVGWLFLILIECNALEKLRFIFKRRVLPSGLSSNVDSDVENEKMRTLRIKETELPKYNLVVKNMSKIYGNFTAVKDLSIAIDESECFGLLGLNGAGKTTTFKMLTGDLKIEYGNAWIQGISLRHELKQIHQRIGYCPQFDAVLKDLSGYENLRVYCLLRGVPLFQIDRVIERFAYELNFQKHLHKQAKLYSGGNLRKLSAAIALVGNPAVVCKFFIIVQPVLIFKAPLNQQTNKIDFLEYVVHFLKHFFDKK